MISKISHDVKKVKSKAVHISCIHKQVHILPPPFSFIQTDASGWLTNGEPSCRRPALGVNWYVLLYLLDFNHINIHIKIQ